MQIDSGVVAADDRAFSLAQSALDELARMREWVSSGKGVPTARGLIARIHSLITGGAAAPAAPAVAAPVHAPVVPAPAPVMAPPPEPDPVACRTRAGTFRQRSSLPLPLPSRPCSAVPSPVSMRAAASASRAAARAAGAGRGVGARTRHRRAPAIEPPSIVTRAPATEPISAGFKRDADTPMRRCCRQAPYRRAANPRSQGTAPELARVDAELLDQLLNNSGEASIARARLEQQIGSIDFNVGELSRTVTRLKEQLRKLELETEAQILHRYEEENGHDERLRSAGAGSLLLDPAVLARARGNRQRRGQHPGPAREPDQGHAEPADAAGADHHRAAERTHAHAHGAVPAARAAPGAHRAPGRHRHGQEGRAADRGRLGRTRPPGARAHDAAVRAHAAQRRGARHRDAGGPQEGRQERDPARSPSRCIAKVPRWSSRCRTTAPA